MDMKRFFLYFMVIAALALAGCGGNGGGGMAGGGNGGDTPTCPPGQTGTPPNCVTPGPTVADLFATAHTERAKAEGAATTAENAVKDATKYSGMLGVLKVKGDSSQATMNADNVLNAKTAANGAVMTAEGALAELRKADTAADTHNNTALNSAIAAAIEAAEQAIKDAKKEADSSDLKTAVQMVTGTNANKPKTSAQAGKTVAEKIEAALMPTAADNGAGIRVLHGSALPPTTGVGADTGKTLVKMNDSMGMTWEQIVGSANVMKKRIVSGSDTKVVDASSVSGLELTLQATPTDRSTTKDGIQVNDGEQFVNADGASVEFKGIPGTVFCQGSDCAVSTATTNNIRTLTGSWYFTPADKEKSYVLASNNRDYEAETLFAQYGHWLTEDDTGLVTVRTFAMSEGNASNLAVNVTDTLTDKSATYTGRAVGMSFRKQLNSDGTVVDGSRQSGAFTADVSLKATFGDAPMLGGTVNNFTSANGDAVNSDWSVTLREGAFANATLANGIARTSTTTQDGVWSAASYGEDGKRPDGIFGGFNAHFSDGHAAGAYATKKQ